MCIVWLRERNKMNSKRVELMHVNIFMIFIFILS
jgi:hypothetical protein